MHKIVFSDRDLVKVRALLVGQSIELKELEKTDCLAADPLMVTAGERGGAVVFPYGAVVLFDLNPLEEVTFLNHLSPLITKAFASPEVEDTSICRDATTKAQIKDDTIVLPEFTISSFQIVADILAKSVILAYYEVQTTSAFERIEPFTVSLQH